MRIVFLGTGDIGLPSLEALLASREHEVVAVVTQPDSPAGRGMEMRAPKIKTLALSAGVPVLQPDKVRHHVEELAAFQADVFVVVAYGQILSRSVLDIPRLGCLNIHASLLPRHRGAAPIQAAIRDDDTETGITIMWMDVGLDTGDMLLKKSFPIRDDDTGGTLHDRLAELAPKCLLEALSLVEAGAAPREVQDSTKATVIRKLDRSHGRLDWSKSAEELERLIRAYQPWPGTFCLLPAVGDAGKSMPLKIYRAAVVPAAEVCPVAGTVVEAGPRFLVACGSGVLQLLEVQLEGRKRLPAADFLRGYPLEVGSRLS